MRRPNINQKVLLFQEISLNDTISVYEDGYFRWLEFDNQFFQTLVDKSQLDKPMLAYLPALCLNITHNNEDSVLMLGAGGGAIYHYINKVAANVDLTLVELNRTIIEIAHQLFYVKQPIIHANAFSYLEDAPLVDHILIDIFTGNALPKQLANIDFLQRCLQKSRQCLSFNLISQQQQQVASFIGLLRQSLTSNTLCIATPNQENVVIHCYKSKEDMAKIERLVENGKMAPPQWDSQLGLVSF